MRKSKKKYELLALYFPKIRNINYMSFVSINVVLSTHSKFYQSITIKYFKTTYINMYFTPTIYDYRET